MDEYKERDLKRVQEIELDILEKFISVCDKYSLEWIVIGGTALGAMRHNGFIPWDDDIDVAMPRKDYNYFLKKAPVVESTTLLTTGVICISIRTLIFFLIYA